MGSLYKLLSDQFAYHVLSHEEERPPHGVSYDVWQRRLDAFRERRRNIADRAFGEYAYALAQKPGDERTVWQIAEVSRGIGQYDRAGELLRALSERQPGEWLYPYRAAAVDLALGKPARAAGLLRQAHGRKPDQADVLAFVRADRGWIADTAKRLHGRLEEA